MATSSSAAALEADDGSASLSTEQAADDTYAYTLKCETGFIVAGLQEGEAASAFVRVLCTLITVSVVSSWVTRRDCIYKLPLFFSHWLSGLVHQLVYLIGATMISVCWAGENLAIFIKTLKFLELFASNMLAITNLAICVNLSLIVMSHRPQSHVRSISTHKLVLLFLALSAGLAAIAVPFWGLTVLSGTGFWELGENKRDHQFVMISTFMVEFLVGMCMFVIVSWLLLFRMTEIKECWMMHACLRYYFGLTLLGTVGNLTLGVCGTIYVISDMSWPLLMIFSWGFRQVRIALDTIVLHSVLATKSVDERAETPPFDDASPTPPPASSRGSRRLGGAHRR
ncbi:unnamed protein product [Ectocarpus sp. 8 AP-2014]